MLDGYEPLPLAVLWLLVGLWGVAWFAALNPRWYLAMCRRYVPLAWLVRRGSPRRDVRLARLGATAAVGLLGLVILLELAYRFQ
jgi:hypothetical protein